MSAGNTLYYPGFFGIEFVSSVSVDVYKVALLGTAYSFSSLHTLYSHISANEISATGYTSGGKEITVNITKTNPGILIEPQSVSWSTPSGSGATIAYAVLYNSNSGALLLNVPLNANGYPVIWSSTNRLFTLTFNSTLTTNLFVNLVLSASITNIDANEAQVTLNFPQNMFGVTGLDISFVNTADLISSSFVLEPTVSSLTLTNLSSSTPYLFSARNRISDGILSQPLTSSFTTIAPYAPLNFFVTESAPAALDFSWNHPVQDVGIQYYQIQYASGSGSFFNLSNVNFPTSSYSSSLFEGETEYKFRIRSVDAQNGTSVWAPNNNGFEITTSLIPPVFLNFNSIVKTLNSGEAAYYYIPSTEINFDFTGSYTSTNYVNDLSQQESISFETIVKSLSSGEAAYYYIPSTEINFDFTGSYTSTNYVNDLSQQESISFETIFKTLNSGESLYI